jgi:hypothetical protein
MSQILRNGFSIMLFINTIQTAARRTTLQNSLPLKVSPWITLPWLFSVSNKILGHLRTVLQQAFFFCLYYFVTWIGFFNLSILTLDWMFSVQSALCIMGYLAFGFTYMIPGVLVLQFLSIHLFVQSFNKCPVSMSCVPGTVLSIRYIGGGRNKHMQPLSL